MKNTFEPLIAEMAQKAAANAIISHDDYFDDDGLLCCGSCHTPKQTVIEFCSSPMVVHCDCKCLAQKHRAEREAEQLQQRIMFCRDEAFDNAEMLSWDLFAVDDGEEPEVSRAVRLYIDNFDKFKVDGRGLLFWSVINGNGKSLCAATVVNELVNRGIACRMVEMGMILKEMQGEYHNNQSEYIRHFHKYDLLVIDDLGTERRTEWANESVYDFINERYKLRKPTIFTTNLPIEQLKGGQTDHERQIFERILRMTHPIHITHASRRRRESAEKFLAEKEILGI